MENKIKDISPEIRRFLGKVKMCPGMWIGSNSVRDLQSFMLGMSSANDACAEYASVIIPEGFKEYVAKRYEQSSSNAGSLNNVLQCKQDEEAALTKWFELLDEYLVSVGLDPIALPCDPSTRTIKAVVFDIGQTLAYYPIPLNWSKLYRPAFENVAEKLGLEISGEEYAHIGKTLRKYNTRIVPRQIEVSSDRIFGEIIRETSISPDLMNDVKREFYSYFRNEVVVYPEAEEVLTSLRRRGLPIATLSDVAYGMDNKFALDDIRPLLKYIDKPFTSNDTGFRKPSPEGLHMIASQFGVLPSEIAFVGDEWKDMDCALRAGALGVLIDRTGNPSPSPSRGALLADTVITDLRELLKLV